jgi:hypothetical protein
LLVTASFVSRERARVGTQHAAIQLHDARGHGVEERSVVRDEDARAAPSQQSFQERDAVDVQVVGWLVEQQQLRLEGHRER